MKDRARLNNGKSSKLMCPSTYNPASFSAFLQDLKDGVVYVDITANNSTGSDAGVSEVGTALNKANLLSDTTAQGFGFDVSDNATVDDVLGRIGADYITGTLAVGQTTVTLLDARIKTTSKYDIYVSKWSAQPYEVTVTSGSMVLTFDAQDTSVTVSVRVY